LHFSFAGLFGLVKFKEGGSILYGLFGLLKLRSPTLLELNTLEYQLGGLGLVPEVGC